MQFKGVQVISAFERKERESASQYVVQSIQKAIRLGELKIGDRIPSESELSESLGVGRSSVREGIKILATFGILEVKQGQGTFVTDNFIESIFNALGFTLVGDNLHYLLQVRKVLECGCMKLICGKLTREDLDHLGTLAIALDPKADPDANIAADGTFHKTLVRYTGNSMMIRIYSMVNGLIDKLMAVLMQHEEIVQEAREAHIEIVQALSTEDPQASFNAMERHLSRVETYAEQFMN